jgi:hypothetical protein
MDIQTHYQFAERINSKGFILVVIVSWLIAGTLDALAATFILGKGNWAGVFKFVASGLYGKDAFTGGNAIAIQGLIMHYIIALSFTLVYFFSYPYLGFLHKNVVLSSIIYGVFVFVVMTFCVVPLSKIGFRSFQPVPALINLIILMLCISLPITYIASKYYAKPTVYNNQM